MICLSMYKFKAERANSDRYFNKNKFELTGIIVGKKAAESGHDAGMLRVKIISSNRSYYDIRSTHKPYYCVIRKGEAELIESGLCMIQTLDSVVVSSKDEICIYRKGVLQEEHPLYLTLTSFGSGDLRKLHEL